MIKRIFDISVSLIALILFLPFFVILAILITIDSKGGIFYKQQRIGRNEQPFLMYKFRTMFTDADKKGLLTVGNHDNRITRMGYFLRKYKLDELPQLWNVLLGDMSLVGPRPEVKRYVDLYNTQQRQVFNIRPGLTDYASFDFINENELLAKSKNPEETYIQEILPKKLELSLQYIREMSFFTDIKIILKTIKKIISG